MSMNSNKWLTLSRELKIKSRRYFPMTEPIEKAVDQRRLTRSDLTGEQNKALCGSEFRSSARPALFESVESSTRIEGPD